MNFPGHCYEKPRASVRSNENTSISISRSDVPQISIRYLFRSAPIVSFFFTFFKRAFDTTSYRTSEIQEKLRIIFCVEIVLVNNNYYYYRLFINSRKYGAWILMWNYKLDFRPKNARGHNALKTRISQTLAHDNTCTTYRTQLHVRSFPFINFKLSYTPIAFYKLLLSLVHNSRIKKYE